MSEVALRKTIYDLVQIRRQVLGSLETMHKAYKEADDLMESINSHIFYRLDSSDRGLGLTDPKAADQSIWFYMIKLYNLEKYMLCTEYQKMVNQIYDYNFPEFTVDNAEAWLFSLKALVYESVQKLIEDVFNRITQETYRTGGSWNSSTKKKRNNNGIDSFFIISTGDFNQMRWHSGRPTITDDLEKACYIIDGKELPEVTLKSSMAREKIWESENEYFWIRVCGNGNTHYKIKDNIREKLNIYGSKKGIIGENIRIKIFDKNVNNEKGW